MAKNAALAASNTELKEQLDHYCAKFSEFQSTVLRSNEVRKQQICKLPRI